MTNNNGTFCTTTLIRKKRGKITSLRVTSPPITWLTSLSVTSLLVTSGDVISDDVTSGSTPFPNYDGLQVLKTVKY